MAFQIPENAVTWVMLVGMVVIIVLSAVILRKVDKETYGDASYCGPGAVAFRTPDPTSPTQWSSVQCMPALPRSEMDIYRKGMDQCASFCRSYDANNKTNPRECLEHCQGTVNRGI